MFVTCISRRRFLHGFGAGGLAVLLVGRPWSAFAAQDDEEEVDLAKVPKQVRAAADNAVPSAKWTVAYRYKEDGDLFYDLEGRDGKKRPVTVVVTAAGKVEEVETELPVSEVPAVVRDALKAKFPRFKPKTAFEIVTDGKVESYDFEGRRPKDKHDIVVSVSADGKTVEIDEDAP